MKKEQAQTQTFSPFVKQISGSFNNTSAAVIELIMQFACLFCPTFFQWLLLWGSGNKDPLVCLLSYMTLNKLLILNPQVAVIWSVIWGQELLP